MRRVSGKTISYSAPVGGWNVRDSIDQMPVTDAVQLINWFPSSGKVISRKGFTVWSTGLTGSTETLAEFNAKTNRKMIAANNGSIYDVSSSGAIGSALASGFTSNRWQWAQFDDASGGARMGLVNGEDAPQIYNGSTITGMTVSGSGLTTSNLIGVNVFKSRSYFWEKDSQDFWYSSVNALGGTLTKFPLSRVSSFGGNLIAMANWSRDAGDGEDDLAVFVMSSGDIIVYKGDNPGDADAWSLVGVYKSGAPLGIRAIYKQGPDVVLTTKDGYVSLAKIINIGRITEQSSVSDKINNELIRIAPLYASNFGWQTIFYPLGKYMLFNIPTSSTTFEQHIVNTETRVWCKFSGMNAPCWSLYNDNLYFGGIDGKIYKADDGFSDNGNAITWQADCAWNYIGTRQNSKKMTAFRPFMNSTAEFNFTIGIGTDFNSPSNFSTYNSGGTAGAAWDEEFWDDPFWADESTIVNPWLSLSNYGYNFMLRVIGQSMGGQVEWYSYEYIYEHGGYI